MRNVTARAEGTYKCEVSTEGPIFDTDYKQANLTVIGNLKSGFTVPKLVTGINRMIKVALIGAWNYQ